MNRRALCVSLGTTGLSLLAGCTALSDDERGYTYRLEITETGESGTETGESGDEDGSDETRSEVLDYETAGLTRSQRDIVEEAIRTGAYSEANVTWDSLPGREGISMEFRMVIQLIARHLDRDATVDGETTFETPSRYDGTIYRSVVVVE